VWVPGRSAQVIQNRQQCRVIAYSTGQSDSEQSVEEESVLTACFGLIFYREGRMIQALTFLKQ
jgi:hypothetical protein